MAWKLANYSVPCQMQPGTSYLIHIEIENLGYAAPFNPRPVEVVLRRIDGAIYTETVPLVRPNTPNFWLPRRLHRIDHTIALPAGWPAGDYEVLLNMPDPDWGGRPEYSIRFVNPGVWEPETGYNKLICYDFFLPIVLK